MTNWKKKNAQDAQTTTAPLHITNKDLFASSSVKVKPQV